MNGDQWLDEQATWEHGIKAGFKQGFQAGYTTGYEKGKLSQKAVLDKIRAEIEEERRGYPPSAEYYKAIVKVLQILDKYKAESEE